jgi:type IV pilus assembly protein PilA
MLSRIRKAMDEREEGFTLIELLVVMIIIGILAAIAIPVFLNQRKSGYDAGTKSDVKNAATAEETYYTDSAATPPTYLLGTEGGAAAATDLTGAATPLPGWKRSAHTKTVVVAESTTAGTGKGYLITGTSESGKNFCYDSGASDKGVYSC